MASASPIISPPASPIPSYSITLLLGIVSQIRTCQLARTATLEEAEIASKWELNLGDLELEFSLFDLSSNETRINRKSTVIGQLDLEKFSLIARPTETFERPTDPASVNQSGNRSTSDKSNPADANNEKK
jgi:ABC-type uncharacterized transport system involved in gliding motility auxiliary subunit